MAETIDIIPHAGPQERAHRSRADILVYGGSAGGGKTRFLVVEPLRHVHRAGFRAVVFRTTYPRITQPGSLWDESKQVYSYFGGNPNEGNLSWKFAPDATIKFSHLGERDLMEQHGAQYALIGMDEATEFQERSFRYLASRNRTTCGIRPYMRLTCNPDSESWLATFIDWWIGEDGYPIPERSGKIRWLIIDDEDYLWFDTKEAAVEHACTVLKIPRSVAEIMPQSVTFIDAKLSDNPTLDKGDPSYRARLMALPIVDRERLLGGNWKIRPQAGIMFPRDKWEYLDAMPSGLVLHRYWDKAATKGGKGARTAGVLTGYRASDQRWFLCDVVWGRWGDLEREATIKATAEMDRARFGHIPTTVEQEPGSGGKDSALLTIRNLAGHDIRAERAATAKHLRWKPMAAQVQAGNFTIVKGEWPWPQVIAEMDQLSGDAKQDETRLRDVADGASGGFNRIALGDMSQLPDELLCSSGQPEEPITADEMEEVNPFWAEIMGMENEDRGSW